MKAEAMTDIKVKPLEWDGDEYVGWSSYAVGLSYHIDDESAEDECFILSKGERSSTLKSAHASLCDAQDFAQDDFKRRIIEVIDQA